MAVHALKLLITVDNFRDIDPPGSFMFKTGMINGSESADMFMYSNNAGLV